MSEDSRNMNDDLLVKYITGEADAMETAAVENWLQESEANQNYFNKLELSWTKAGESYPPLEVNTQKAWHNLSERIYKHEEKEQSPNAKSPFYYPIRIAAVLVLGLFIYQQFLNNDAVVNQNLIAQNSLVKDTLSDGSIIALNKDSELSFPEKFHGKTRSVSLKGEAFFDIKPDKEHPFVIESEIGLVKVLGTSFNVVARSKSDMEVQVESGLVQLSIVSNDNKDTSSIFLEAGTSGVINHLTGELSKNENKDPASSFWLDKRLNFNKTPLIEVFDILESNYEIDIDFDSEMIRNCKLTAKFENDDLTTIMSVIAATFKFEVDSSQTNILKVEADDPNCKDENS